MNLLPGGGGALLGRRPRTTLTVLGLCVATVVLWLLALPTVGWTAARADQAIAVLSNSHEVRFGNGVTFHLKVSAPSVIQDVTLYYQRVGEDVTVKVHVPFAPGDNAFSYAWELESGEVAVGARIEYYWRVTDAAGDVLTTPQTSLAYDDDRFGWKTMEKANIALLWYGSSEGQATRLLGYAEESLARQQGEMGITLDQPVKIYVYESKSDMSLALPRQSAAYDDRILTLGVAVDRSTLLILGQHPDVKGTMAHELTHIVVGLATHNPYAPPPRWLDEGLAMYAEGALPSGNKRALEDAVRRNALISVRSLSGYAGDPALVDLFYGEVYSVVDLLLKTYGKEKMAQLLAIFREGQYQEQALQRVYGFGIDELDARWRKSLGLDPRVTPVPDATPEPAPTPAQGPRGGPCLSFLGAGLAGVAFLAGRRRSAGAA